MSANDHDRRGAADKGAPPVDPFELQDVGEFMRSLSEETKAWLEAQKKYHALVASERIARLTAGLLSGVLLGLVVLCVLMFMSISAAIWIGHQCGDTAVGFAIVAAAYLVLGLLFLWWWHSRYRDHVVLQLINKIYHG